jgi:hypothetical protein
VDQSPPAPISTTEQADESPAGLAALWSKEIGAAKEMVRKWHDQGDKIIERYLDDRGSSRRDLTRLNLFTANTQTMEALLFGKSPKVDVQRRFADQDDDQARVAGEMLERILNTDIERDDDPQQEAFRNALSDRLRPGLAVVRCLYEVGETEIVPGTPAQTDPQTGAVTAPAVPEQETRPNEKVSVEYAYWKDVLWSPCRTFSELRWVAFAAEMSEGQFNGRFKGKEAVWTANRKNPASAEDSTKVKDPLDRCVVWEIWSKEKKSVYWYVVGAEEILDSKPDPLGLTGFWPFPRPMFANLTTSKLLPTPDFTLAQDLYDEIDNVSSRIVLLERCVRVVGVYDKNNEELKRLVSQTAQNEMIGVDSWAAFSEKGGIKGATDWMPIDQVVATLDKLREYRTELIGLLYQVTGMSDIMRGQASQQTTATEQAIKARFASVRVQTLQDEFARFVSDTQKIKAEIISKHFDPNTIIKRSNIQRTPDAQLANAAMQLIKDPDFEFRISVNPDSVSLQDFAALKQERTEFAQTLATYFQGMLPMLQALGQIPGALGPAVDFVLRMGQGICAGLKGANEIEGVFDQFIAELKTVQQQAQQQAQQQPPPPPDPKLEAAKVKADAEKFNAKASVMQTGMDLQVAREKHAMDMQKLHLGIQSEEAKARAQAIQAVDGVSAEGST